MEDDANDEEKPDVEVEKDGLVHVRSLDSVSVRESETECVRM